MNADDIYALKPGRDMDGNWRVTMEEIRGDWRYGEASAVTLAWAVGMAALLVTRKDD